MVARENRKEVVMALAKGTLHSLPAILAAIPATAIAGKILIEVKKIGEEVKAAGKSKEEEEAVYKEAVRQLVERYGGKAAFLEAIRKELKAERASKNPTYINCAVFETAVNDSLSELEQQKLVDTLTSKAEAETVEIARFANAFREDYFGDNYEACDNAIEIGEGYIAFNFDDMSDHPYDEEDLKTIRDMLNKMVGREVFDEYEGFGTDDSCGY